VKNLLNKEQIAELGIEGGWIFGLQDFVRYGDLDNYNHVNNKVYHAWFENLRVLYLLNLGIEFDEESQIKPVVRVATIEFNAPMHMDEDYVTVCKVSKLGRTSFVMEQAVWVEGQFRVTAATTVVLVNETATESRPIPDSLRKIFVERDGAKTS
jgi:acyl-CoA thioester hydrolase